MNEAMMFRSVRSMEIITCVYHDSKLHTENRFRIPLRRWENRFANCQRRSNKYEDVTSMFEISMEEAKTRVPTGTDTHKDNINDLMHARWRGEEVCRSLRAEIWRQLDLEGSLQETELDDVLWNEGVCGMVACDNLYTTSRHKNKNGYLCKRQAIEDSQPVLRLR